MSSAALAPVAVFRLIVKRGCLLSASGDSRDSLHDPPSLQVIGSDANSINVNRMPSLLVTPLFVKVKHFSGLRFYFLWTESPVLDEMLRMQPLIQAGEMAPGASPYSTAELVFFHYTGNIEAVQLFQFDFVITKRANLVRCVRVPFSCLSLWNYRVEPVDEQRHRAIEGLRVILRP